MANLKLTDVEKTYGGTVTVLRDIDLDIKEGELIVFVGPSGCGKSTLLRMIAGLEKITGGTLEIDGMVVNDVPPSQRGIAMVFQSYALYPHMTVYDNMAFALKIAGDDKETIDRKVRAAAEKLQLTNFLDRLPKALSGGQRQRVAIGRSIVRDPKVYLFDEPLSNLDAALRVATRIEIAQLKEQMPESTMIYVTHDQVEAMTLATRIVVLAGGGIAQVGSPLTLYEKPASTFVAQFIGSPAMNLLAERSSAPARPRRWNCPRAAARSPRITPPSPRTWARPCRSASGPRTWCRPTATTTPSTARSTSSRPWVRSRSFISTRRARITRPTPSSPSCMASTPTCADRTCA
jgi:alpha-glucoside transport system ATP-binding protein